MPEYAFDCKLWAVCRVQAPDEKTAREKMYDVLNCFDMCYDHDGVLLTEASLEEGANEELFEIDGEAV